MSDLKTLNLNLETNLHRQNKENQQTEKRARSRQPTDRPINKEKGTKIQKQRK